MVLPGMLERGSGRIVNIGSGFGAVGYPFHVSYSASKFGLRGFSEALRRELHGSNIGVTHVSPRATRTAMLDAEIAKAGALAGEFEWERWIRVDGVPDFRRLTPPLRHCP